jgi:hypothetical protein
VVLFLIPETESSYAESSGQISNLHDRGFFTEEKIMSGQGALKKWTFLSLLLCVLALAGQPLAFGQATTGTISGVILDEKQGTVPEATVTVRNLDTNATHSVTTKEDGRFSFTGLPVGRYELTVERTGFAKHVRGPITLVLNQVAVMEVELKAAAVSETVTVTTDAPLLNTTSPEVGVRFDEKRISNLPTSGQFGNGGGFRDVFAYALSAPGVSQLNTGNSTFSTGTSFSVNGSRTRGNNFMIDGQDSNDPSITGRQQVINNPDIVQEFRLITNQFAAEYGRAAGSVVNVITKSGTNSFHGSAFWFYDSNAFNARSNVDKNNNLKSAPFLNEHQFGGTFGGPIWKDHTFFFVSLQRWTIRKLGSGVTISGVPTDVGKATLQSSVGTKPQIQALLKFLPAANGSITPGPGVITTASYTFNGQPFTVPLGTLTSSTSSTFDDWQWSARLDHNFGKHQLGGRFLYDDGTDAGNGQVTPPGLTTLQPARRMAQTLFLISNFSPRTLNEVRLSWQRLGSHTTASDITSQQIPSIEIPELGLNGFNASNSRTAIGLAVNLPQFRINNTYQVQDTVAWTRGAHAVKFGIDFRRVDVQSFFVPTLRGLLRYSTLQRFVDDIADAANINQPLPGGTTINNYRWYDYFAFVQDTWAVHRTLSLTLGLRYETPGNAIASLFPLNDSIVSTNGGQSVFQLTPRPTRHHNWQPRVGFSWNPRTRNEGILGWFTGGDKLVVRGGYSRTNDYQFLNIALNIASAFPFLAAVNNSNLANAFTVLPTLRPSFTGPLAPDCAAAPTKANCLTRTIVAGDFRSPVADQFSFEVQRQFLSSNVLRIGYVGTRGTALFQTLDGNPRTLCDAVPIRITDPTTNPPKFVVLGCPRVDPTRGVIRTRANAASSIYHSLQISFERRFSHGFGVGAHYTWSSFIDTASEIFNPSPGSEVAIAQNTFDLRSDRGRSTYDRPHRFSANFVWELPVFRGQQGVVGHILGGWQVASSITFQSGSPFTPLNGSDPTAAEGGIDGLVGNAIRPNLAPGANIFGMSIQDILAAGGVSLFTPLRACVRIPNTLTCSPTDRFGNVGRNVLRSAGIRNADFSLLKSTRIRESHEIQLRADFFDLTNTRNFGIPDSHINNRSGFGNVSNTDGGNRRIFLSLRYVF